MRINSCFCFSIFASTKFMVSTRRKKAAVSAEFIEDSDESDGNETYQDEEYVSPHFSCLQFTHLTLFKFISREWWRRQQCWWGGGSRVSHSFLLIFVLPNFVFCLEWVSLSLWRYHQLHVSLEDLARLLLRLPLQSVLLASMLTKI